MAQTTLDVVVLNNLPYVLPSLLWKKKKNRITKKQAE